MQPVGKKERFQKSTQNKMSLLEEFVHSLVPSIKEL